ncbi:hypothetical protein PsorP6_009801 [Peronosclerospora sorghi]|uniref:Uncharacterized protein n=1 Tax=Peronosclerospora sorghi TaxID=230839 RepID=A0ACC0VZ01_9STRA|nr:hypothetical protein PsorP6_009801 [Peronosclerospora sorghi]
MTEHAALLLSTQEATSTYTEEIERLTQQLHALRCTSEGPDKELEKELENANNSVKAAIVVKEEATRHLQAHST